MASMNFDEAVQYLLSLGHETLTIKLGLRNTEVLLEQLGNPQHSFASLQIAGTNGKGSTAVMLDSICRHAGLTTGLFTSPHLISITERIAVNGCPISRADFGRITGQVKQSAERAVAEGKLSTLPTFFEHVTAIALLAFKEAGVELAILETGMGGRLDATTVAGAKTTVITPIALDHQEYLGQTIPEIGFEKAAIIRPGVNAIIAPQVPDAMEVINRRCAEVNVTPAFAACEAQVTGSTTDGRLEVTFITARETYRNVLLGLRGRHQVENACVAIRTAESLQQQDWRISTDAIVAGLEGAVNPGRLELHEGTPAILLDGAHNPSGARSLRAFLDEFVHAPVTLIFGGMKDKQLEEMARVLIPAANQLILTTPENPRAADTQALGRIAAGLIDESRIMNVPAAVDALETARRITQPGGLICVTGSLYLVGEIKSAIDAQPSLHFVG
jgi:dihydrofolate synthase/folylpolyglutamate synthase